MSILLISAERWIRLLVWGRSPPAHALSRQDCFQCASAGPSNVDRAHLACESLSLAWSMLYSQSLRVSVSALFGCALRMVIACHRYRACQNMRSYCPQACRNACPGDICVVALSHIEAAGLRERTTSCAQVAVGL